MKDIALTTVMIVMLVSSANALERPKGSRQDSRIQEVIYEEKDVVEINCYPGIATHIVFAQDEEILDIASGFTKGWEFSNRRNNLYLKSKLEKADTNLIVVTNKRNYSFKLVLHKNNSLEQIPQYNPRVAFRVNFTYPDEEYKKAKQAIEKQVVKNLLEQKNTPRNWQYSMELGKDSQNIEPTMAYDDGRFTYLKFPNNREIPAAFIVAPDNSESLTNTHIEGDVLIIHKVAPQFMLRLGNSVIGVFNESFDKDNNEDISKDGVSVEGLKRNVIDPNNNE
jgi:type IV secretion system protein VirB9